MGHGLLSGFTQLLMAAGPSSGTPVRSPAAGRKAWPTRLARSAAGFQLTEEFVDFFGFLHLRKPVVHIVGYQVGFGLSGGFVVLHLVLHPVECSGLGAVADSHAGAVGFVQGARAAVL